MGANGASSVSDETLRRYLLCRLGEAERLRLDERLLIDDELAERVLLGESELMDEYAAGKLDSVERQLFDRRFLTTESRRQQLRFSSALHEYAGSQTQPVLPKPVARQEKSSWQEGLAGLFGFGRPRAWAVAGSFAVVILLVGLAWFATRQIPDTEPVITRNEPIPASSPQAPPHAEASPAAQTSPEPQPTPVKSPAITPTPVEPSIPATIASLVLLPGAVRDGGEMQRVAVPDGERDLVRLSLVLETDAAGTYRAELATAEGQMVSVRTKLRATPRNGDTRVILEVPARLVRSGDYQIKLTRQKTDGELEPVGRYSFRALQQ